MIDRKLYCLHQLNRLRGLCGLRTNYSCTHCLIWIDRNCFVDILQLSVVVYLFLFLLLFIASIWLNAFTDHHSCAILQPNKINCISFNSFIKIYVGHDARSSVLNVLNPLVNLKHNFLIKSNRNSHQYKSYEMKINRLAQNSMDH